MTITTKHLCKEFQMGDQVVNAVNQANVTIPLGAFAVVMGPSGSGKSTLLYLLGGLDIPTSGSIEVDGESIEKMDETALAKYRKNKVGFVFQAFHLIPTMIARENVAFPMRFSGVATKNRHGRAKELLELVGLAERANHLPTQLSGGQMQRVAIARALANDPSILLADEPTGNLDHKVGREIIDLLARLNKQGKTVVVVTHDPSIEAYATQVIYMLDGFVVTEDEYKQTLTIKKREGMQL